MGITRQQALDCFASDDLIGVGMEADAVRRQLHPERVVGYSMVCPISCSPLKEIGAASDASQAEALHQIFSDIDAAVAMGATGIALQEHGATSREVAGYERLFYGIKQRFPQLSLQGLSAKAVHGLATHAETSLREIMMRLQGAGLDTVEASQDGLAVEEWLRVHRTAHTLGMHTVAALVFGGGETMEQRVDLLEEVRSLQEDTGGFAAVAVRSATARDDVRLGSMEEPTSVELLKTIAVSRMLLDGVPHMQTTPLTQGIKVLQMSLRFGGDDAGSVFADTAVFDNAKGTGKGRYLVSEEDLRRLIRDAGFQPAQRDALYRMHFL